MPVSPSREEATTVLANHLAKRLNDGQEDLELLLMRQEDFHTKALDRERV